MAVATMPRFFAPEVVQTSAMDCGPAALKCLLEGFRVPVSYGRLREACQTDVDGTSIDVIEDVANQLGLDAEQTMIPLDHLFLRDTKALPAILVVVGADRTTHFVVAWRRHGALVQVMDPATGRRWMPIADLIAMAHVHEMPIPAEAWREWGGSPEFLNGVRARLRALGIVRGADELIAHASNDPSSRSISALDAATRMVAALVDAQAIDAGASAETLLRVSYFETCGELEAGKTTTSIPASYWSASPLAPNEGEERVLLRGAVLVKMARTERKQPAEGAAPLRPDLVAALAEAPARPLRDLLQLLRKDGLLTPALVVGATIVAAFGRAVEALVLRGALEVGRHLASWHQRVFGVASVVVFLCVFLGIELPILASTLKMGRQLETRLRVAFLSKIPRLGDRYFHSRPTSDMTHRAHSIHSVRQLPSLGFRLFRSLAELLFTTLGLVWLVPRDALLVVGAATLSVVVPWVTQSSLIERDLRVRSFDGALSRFYLDALLGMMPIRTHDAGGALRREHDTMIGELRRSVRGLLSGAVLVEALDAIVGVAVAVWLLFHYLGSGHEPAAALLLIYWALDVPVIGKQIALVMRQYPAIRNLTLRLLEPLGALEDVDPEGSVPATSASERGADIKLSDVTIRAGGTTILEHCDLHVPSGSHVAIVGESGAGKSSLVGLLLGWHRAAEGEVRVDNTLLRGEHLNRLRERTAWVDPTIQIWNRSMLENLEYGNPPSGDAFSSVLEQAGVIQILDRLPEGLGSSLGEGGGLVSGGEGQRVRLARAMLRSRSDLVILDEPFRGLDRERRTALLASARGLWSEATLFCVTHDVGDTLEFPRVLVVEGGRIVEDGPPKELAARDGSRYRALLDAEHMVQRGLWMESSWRRLVLRDGKLEEGDR